MLYTLISLLNHKSFCKALGRSKKTSLCLKQEQILSHTVTPHTYAARSSHKPPQLEFRINTERRGLVAACPSGRCALRLPFYTGMPKVGAADPAPPITWVRDQHQGPHQLGAPAHTHSAGPAATTFMYFAFSLAGSFPLK